MVVDKLRLILQESATLNSRLDKDEFNLAEEVGGNLDDAFELGMIEGEIDYARELLEILAILEVEPSLD